MGGGGSGAGTNSDTVSSKLQAVVNRSSVAVLLRNLEPVSLIAGTDKLAPLWELLNSSG